MKNRINSLILCVAVMMFGTTGVFAGVNTVCVPTSGSFDLIVGVASNFFEPSQDMVANFKATTAGSGKSIQICHDSTTVLKAERDSYDILFLADATAGTVGQYAFSYAKGIPVLFAKHSVISTVGGLIYKNVGGTDVPLSSGNSEPITVANLTPYAINPGLKSVFGSVAIANDSAPYGRAAHDILSSMEGTNLPNTIPTWVRNPLFSNIALTFEAVVAGTGNIEAGFVSKAQICSGIYPQYVNTPPVYTYVEFTDPLYTLDQTASLIPITPNGNTFNQNAVNLYTFIQGRMGATGVNSWSNFLTTHCYGQP